MAEERPVNRRGFFRAGLRELLRGATESVEKIQQAMAAAAPAVTPPDSADLNTSPLRPPGALAEPQFLQTCSRCAKCVEVCPSNCIRIDPEIAGGAPRINPDDMPCIVCESLACMEICPTGALRKTPRFEIDMGTAVWRAQHCIRSKSEECRICVEKCPLGSAAIDIVNNEVAVNPRHCVGCGMCQHFCPTNPKAVVVIPVAAKTA